MPDPLAVSLEFKLLFRLAIEQILLVPGLLEPGWAFAPLRSSLVADHYRVDIWRDRWAFRNLPASVQRIGRDISGDGEHRDLAVVTHSFGDWVVRQAIAQTPGHRIAALVSLAPVMRAGLLLQLMYAITWKLCPEVAVINDAHRAAANIDCDGQLRRLLIWARFDESLRRIDLPATDRTRVEIVTGTHMSLIIQPSVIRRVRDFLQEVSQQAGS